MKDTILALATLGAIGYFVVVEYEKYDAKGTIEAQSTYGTHVEIDRIVSDFTSRATCVAASQENELDGSRSPKYTYAILAAPKRAIRVSGPDEFAYWCVSSAGKPGHS